jgi:outer membrane immunogenic protein
MKKVILGVAITFLFSTTVFAAREGESYFGIQYAMVTYDEDGVDDVEPAALVGKFGKFMTDNVAIEGRIGFGIQDDSVDLGPFEVEVDVETIFGVYAVMQSSGSDSASFYGVLGLTRVELEASAFGVSVSDDDSGLSYGVGVNIGAFNLEYMSYIDDDDYDLTAVSLGYVAKF